MGKKRKFNFFFRLQRAVYVPEPTYINWLFSGSMQRRKKKDGNQSLTICRQCTQHYVVGMCVCMFSSFGCTLVAFFSFNTIVILVFPEGSNNEKKLQGYRDKFTHTQGQKKKSFVGSFRETWLTQKAKGR
jgi:hypothetical protein